MLDMSEIILTGFIFILYDEFINNNIRYTEINTASCAQLITMAYHASQ